ncbi:4a-hydroxytetrahydrobiopterin dehydratase [Marinobacterium sediminicola]|uniref:Putative pterin-4-alpha-carbinolamine dehydratase n=1 Tax=Marinobacterium sediminicola TaxID=518898 RepID=A0ABY1S1D5_9GAMM|nr:4a-hydroxytetrahydrobiopterin dehydratase [Marinobacterium sediminicola]ULG70105.1 4a-hydroxytetrahydrobiopterin dehydratase [Marinobacterium sediminicola]SMR74932.1 4a-hydroxytetrahydrobiopterin dehydratase [Marinobacterium sediminicola]
MSLADKRCVPCRGGVPTLSREEIAPYLEQVENWQLSENASRIRREFSFPDFNTALTFVNHVGRLAEEMGHHPEICFGWGYASVEIWTHKIGGLHENDFVLAAKIDRLPEV